MSKYPKQRQQFLLTFFDKDSYSEKLVNGFWLVKHLNGNSKTYEVNIYTPESFKNYQEYKKFYRPCSKVSNMEQTSIYNPMGGKAQQAKGLTGSFLDVKDRR